jgi:K+-sensing histidine kinase KdpD
MRRKLVGSIVGIVTSMALGAVLLPARSHISVATTGLVLVVPVVAGVAVGGFTAGLVSVAAGFLVYDFVFITPYYTLTVGSAQNWVALGVYAIVMVIVARVVASLEEARSSSQARARNLLHLFEVSELLLVQRPFEEFATSIVGAVQEVLSLSGSALLLSVDDKLEVVASSGTSIPDEELPTIRTGTRIPVPLTTGAQRASVHTLALSAAGRPVGLLVMQGSLPDRTLRELLPTLANHIALALERAQLHERALRAEVLEEIDQWRRKLVGAVSHDLRTPLATMKVASTTLLKPGDPLSDDDRDELYALIDVQTDRLTRLVTNLLDMTRLEAGVLEIDKHPCSALDLIGESLAAMRPTLGDRRVEVDVAADLPTLDVDHLLIGQVLTNLMDNANRHAPPGSAIEIGASPDGDEAVEISVADHGPGVPADQRDSVFQSFMRFDTGGRAGLGLALAKTFVEVHGGRIWVEDAPGGGARFVFTLPVIARAEVTISAPGQGTGVRAADG